MSLESLARSLQGNLTYDYLRERDWDRLAALALGCVNPASKTAQEGAEWAQQHGKPPPSISARESLLCSLGVSLIAYKHARREDLLSRTIADLRDCLKWRLKNTRVRDRWKVAALAVAEWTSDNCPLCTGAGHVYDTIGVQRICPKCSGSRKRRYTDSDRAEGLAVADGSKWAHALDAAHAQIAFAIGLAVRQAQERLK